MRKLGVTAIGAAALVPVAGGGSVKVADRSPYEGAKLARPDHIIVHDFAATSADLPAWSDAAATHANSGVRVSESELQTGRQLGSRVAEELVTRIDAMGLPAVRAKEQPQPSVGDLAIVGYFTSLDKGSAVERVALGFGAGAAEVTAAVEGYLATEDGMRRLGRGTATSEAEKGPGLVVPLVVTAVTANPIGLAVGGAVKVGEELSGHDTIEGVAKRVADKIASELEIRFRDEGWI